MSQTINDKQQLSMRPVPIKDSQFVNPQNGTAMLPSLINPEDEENFEIHRNFYIKGYVDLRDSVRQIRQYEIADQYNNVLTQLDFEDEYWLKFIAMFKSVQKLQLKREARMFPQLLDELNLDHCLNKLFRNGLIMRWTYHHPIDGKDIPVYTLTGNGYRFLKTFYSNSNYFHPQDFLNLNWRYHLRFWETLDVYQVLVSLPAYRASTTMFHGDIHKKKVLLPSSLQINLELTQGKPKNLVFYPALYNDNLNYYKDATIKWNKFTKAGQDLNVQINDLPAGQNVLAFYAPTIERAQQINEFLQLSKFAFPSLFLVGLEITRKGLPQAFFLPDRQTGGLRQYIFPDILRQ